MCPKCGSNSRIGDNNGESCMDCGTPLSGFGCGATTRKCIHSWHAEPHMRRKICTWCEEIAINENYDHKKDTYRHCPDCNKYTEQEITLYNPDYPDDGEAWKCTVCNNVTGFFEP